MFYLKRHLRLQSSVLKVIKKHLCNKNTTQPVVTNRKSLKYLTWFVVGTSLGAGFSYATSSIDLSNFNVIEKPRHHHRPIKNDKYRHLVEYPQSVYHDLPFKITLYQYETSLYSSQIRAYLDYFGFTYEFVEVDSFSKAEIKHITKNSNLPILALEDVNSKRNWYLTNATSIVSALEALRHDYENSLDIIPKYLPILTNKETLKYPNKYATNSQNELNDIYWRKWINNTAIPVLRYYSTHSYLTIFDTVSNFKEKSQWIERFFPPKWWYLYLKLSIKLYNERNTYKNQIENLDIESFQTPTDILDMAIIHWENSLKHKFHGERVPDLADLSMFGVFKAYEGTQLFKTVLKRHSLFYEWYINMSNIIKSNDSDAKLIKPNVVLNQISENIEIQKNDQLPLRIVSTTFIILVMAFAYVASKS